MPGAVWDEEDVKKARALRSAGKPYHIIAKCFPGRSREAVRNVLLHRRQKGRKAPQQYDPMLPALNRVFTRYANDNGLTEIEAKAALLSGWKPSGVAL